MPSLGSPQSLDGCYFSPSLVTDWFWGVVSEAVEELRRSPQRGIPSPDRLERNGPLTTIILQVQTGNKIVPIPVTSGIVKALLTVNISISSCAF